LLGLDDKLQFVDDGEFLSPHHSSRPYLAMLRSSRFSLHGRRRLTATPFRHQTIVQKRTGAPTTGQFFVAIGQHLSMESVV
jgi:hypothetical protein